MAGTDRSMLGAAGERAALDWYLRREYHLVARNWRCSLGELDLVVRRGSLVAFVEVKTRSGSGFGGGYEAVGRQKQRKLRQLGEAFIAAHPLGESRFRFDVASVLSGRAGRAQVEVFEDAF